MFNTFKLALKKILSRKSSFVIIAFITFAITMLIVINSVFDGTDNGIKTVAEMHAEAIKSYIDDL